MRVSRIFSWPAVVMLLAVPLALAGCSTTESAEEQFDDASITTKIKAKLAADPEVNPFEIDVDTQDGVVRLSGFVEEPGDRQEAEKLARDTSGVRSVVNDIKIGDKSVGESVDDAVIVTKVKSKLTADPSLNPFNIDVDAQLGVVTLSGRVNSIEEKAAAERLARETDGVKRVDNRLQVAGGMR